MSFASFGIQHLLATIIFVAITYLSIRVGLKLESERKKMNIALALSSIAWLFLFIDDVQKIINQTYSIQEDLPLFMCRLVAWLLPFALFYKSWPFLRILYFWVLAGTLQAVITPDLEEGFPDFQFFRYFILHFGLIAAMLYTVVVFKLKIQWKDFFKALLWAQVYLFVLMVVNYFLGSNYGYTHHKPAGGSILDLFGEWPYYILGAELFMALMFLILMIPFALRKAMKK